MASHAITNNAIRQGVHLKCLLGKGQNFLTPTFALGSPIWLEVGRYSGTAILPTSCRLLHNGKISLRPLLNYVRSSTGSMSTRCHTSYGHATRVSNENSVCNGREMYQYRYLKSKQNRQHWSVSKYDHLDRSSSQVPSLRVFSTWSRKYKEVKEEGDTKEANAKELTKEQYQYKNWRTLLTVPNLLTASRVILTPYLGHLVLTESYPAACGLFLYAGITDVLDGWIARRYPSQATPVGSFMDPLADKFLVSTLFITLTMVNLIPAPLTCLVVFRDISLIAAAFYVRTISLPPPVTLAAIFDLSNQTAELKPTLISKANTAIQLGLVAMTLAAPVVNCVDHAALQALWYITAATTLWSGIGYIFAKDTFKIYKQHRLKQKQS